MYLIVTATELESQPIVEALAGLSGWQVLVAGVGCLETAVTLGRFLAREEPALRGILNCGVAGAFVGAGPQVLDICLATQEILAEVGVWTENGVEDFEGLEVPRYFPLAGPLLGATRRILEGQGLRPWLGPFVTVQAVSGRESRGECLRRRYGALCENMEGAAVARLAAEFGAPCVELRTVSNMVIDRDPASWRLMKAAERCAQAVRAVLSGLEA